MYIKVAMSNLFLQIFVGLCFFILVIVLFDEKKDYLTYSILVIVLAGIVSSFIIPETQHLEFYIEMIDWEVIFFLILMFTIVEILNEKLIFQEISRRIVKKYSSNIRKLFYFICIVSTLVATILEDLSVAIIFGPIIVIACKEIKINPTPFLLGMTICINLASMLTPFGSAENLMIVNAFDLDIQWFLRYFLIYFICATAITLVLLDKFVLSKYINSAWNGFSTNGSSERQSNFLEGEGKQEEKNHKHIFYTDNLSIENSLMNLKVDQKVFKKNIIGLGIFAVLLIVVPTLYLPCFIGLLLFVFLNPVQKENSNVKSPSIAHYFKLVDFKLIFFFMCLFVLVGLMEVNGTILYLETLIQGFSGHNLFGLCILIIILSSVLSAFMDNAPVTIIFIPIIGILISLPEFSLYTVPIMFSFILGVNLGGNFLPQGSAADMMTLEVARTNGVFELSYKKLFRVGGLFALLHIIMGIIYLGAMIYIFL